ncbi:MAG TPA: hypothetical protein VLB46_13630 [Pyrinomonadaceae bacterium]|nr:hypothetical protein [Pyrinomonadaceae bacterium]
MKEEPVSDALLRQFLLGNVDDQERQRLESMFVTGALSGERVMAAEQHLLDDFLENSLTPEDRARFLAQYGATPEEQRKLRIAKSIQEWEDSRQGEDALAAANASRWSSVGERFWQKPVFLVPVAAVFLIALICSAVWLRSRSEQRNSHLAMQQELVRLNTPSMLREVSPATPPLQLMPGTVRSAEAENELTPPLNAEFVELRLVWTQRERYPSYQATIRRFDEDEIFKIPIPQADKDNDIRLRLPREFLIRGFYQVEVSGVSDDGTVALPEEYRFVVKG